MALPPLRLWPFSLPMVVLGAMLWWQHSNDAVLSPQAALGKLVFHDASLSASGQQSCATCHVASLGHASAQGIEKGGDAMQHAGLRNVPSLRYVKFNPGLQWDDEGKASGGFFWDGRADSLQAQAAEPFLNPHEMANRTKAEVVAKLKQSAYAAKFNHVYGQAFWEDSEQSFALMTQALARYQEEDPVFAAFSSQFDRVMRGQAQFSAAQERGWRVFKDENKGNCAACHTAETDNPKQPALFTDFSYDNLGVPRNPRISANSDPQFHDLGLCAAHGSKAISSGCGAFKVPSLRNVAVRRVFFHNACFNDLREVIAFYATRDTDPARWYGQVSQRFNDTPKRLHSHVNTSEAPYGQKRGEQAKLSEQDIDDVLAFLYTLSDADLVAAYAAPQGATALPRAAVRAGQQAPSQTLSSCR